MPGPGMGSSVAPGGSCPGRNMGGPAPGPPCILAPCCDARSVGDWCRDVGKCGSRRSAICERSSQSGAACCACPSTLPRLRRLPLCAPHCRAQGAPAGKRASAASGPPTNVPRGSLLRQPCSCPAAPRPVLQAAAIAWPGAAGGLAVQQAVSGAASASGGKQCKRRCGGSRRRHAGTRRGGLEHAQLDVARAPHQVWAGTPALVGCRGAA